MRRLLFPGNEFEAHILSTVFKTNTIDNIGLYIITFIHVNQNVNDLHIPETSGQK